MTAFQDNIHIHDNHLYMDSFYVEKNKLHLNPLLNSISLR